MNRNEELDLIGKLIDNVAKSEIVKECFDKVDRYCYQRSTHKQNNDLNKRKEQMYNLKMRNPYHIPIIVESYDTTILKLLMNPEARFSELMHHIRKRMLLKPEEGIYVITENNQMLTNTMEIGYIYKRALSNNEIDDGCLYLFIKKESVFGFNR